LVTLDIDEETCSIGLGGAYPGSPSVSCRSCTFCGFRSGGPDERDNAAFTADCTNIPGGRYIDTCESTFPFFYPVDFFDPNYGGTSYPTETPSPSVARTPAPPTEQSFSLGPSILPSETPPPTTEQSSSLGPSIWPSETPEPTLKPTKPDTPPPTPSPTKGSSSGDPHFKV
jgi:hypothetical protein